MFRMTLTLVLMALAAVGGFYCGCKYTNLTTQMQTPVKEEVKTLDPTVLQKKLSQVAELASSSYEYTEQTKHEKKEKLWGFNVPFSTSSIIIQYSGTIKAGIDLAKAKFDIQDTVVTFFLPKAKILSHDIDSKSLRIVNKENGLFSSISIEDFQKFNVEQRDSVEARALREGLLEHAQDKANESLSLITDPLISNGYTVFLRAMTDSMEMAINNEVPIAQAPAQ